MVLQAPFTIHTCQACQSVSSFEKWMVHVGNVSGGVWNADGCLDSPLGTSTQANAKQSRRGRGACSRLRSQLTVYGFGVAYLP